MKSKEECLVIESIAYWRHEYYEAATKKKLEDIGDFAGVIMDAMRYYAEEVAVAFYVEEEGADKENTRDLVQKFMRGKY